METETHMPSLPKWVERLRDGKGAWGSSKHQRGRVLKRGARRARRVEHKRQRAARKAQRGKR